MPEHHVCMRGGERFAVGKILALGRNYAAHAREMGAAPDPAPLVFLKPASALVGDGGTVVRPPYSLDLHHELECVLLIGETGKNIATEDARRYVAGYAVGLDMTLRDVQSEAKRRGHPWSVAKGFDTAAPVSEFVPAAEVEAPERLQLTLHVNGTLRQEGCVGDMELPLFDIVRYLSAAFTLERGDLVFTGTPAGVGAVFPGDRLEAQLVGHTRLTVTVEG